MFGFILKRLIYALAILALLVAVLPDVKGVPVPW